MNPNDDGYTLCPTLLGNRLGKSIHALVIMEYMLYRGAVPPETHTLANTSQPPQAMEQPVALRKTAYERSHPNQPFYAAITNKKRRRKS